MKGVIKTLIDFLNENIIPISLLALYALITHLFNLINCPFKLIFGIPCPGCGMTRAALSILKFDFVSAWNYNPIIFILPFIVMVIIFKDFKMIKKINSSKVFWGSILLLVFTCYVLRFIFVYPNSPMDYNKYNLLRWLIDLFQRLF